MPLISGRDINETDTAYWVTRVRSLEILVCELLMKNERLRVIQDATLQEGRETVLHIEPPSGS